MVKNIFLVRRMYRHPFLLTRESNDGVVIHTMKSMTLSVMASSGLDHGEVKVDFGSRYATPWFTKMHPWNKMSTYKIRLQESNDGGDEMNDIVSANSNNIFLELSNNMIPLRRLLFNPRSGERFLSTHYLSSVWYPSSWASNSIGFFISKNFNNAATNIFPPPTGAHGRYSNITINQAAVVISADQGGVLGKFFFWRSNSKLFTCIYFQVSWGRPFFRNEGNEEMQPS